MRKLIDAASGFLDRHRHSLLRHHWLETATLVGGGVAAASFWGFMELADYVSDGSSQSLDEKVLLALRNPADLEQGVGPWWLEQMAVDTTALGGTTVLVLITLVTAGFLGMERKYRAMSLVLIAVLGGQALSSGLKLIFERERPSIIPHTVDVMTHSFPSGHSMMAAVVYLTLGSLLVQFLKNFRARFFVMSVVVFVTIMIGLSRVYLGVHYPTDVVAGWTAGAFWAFVCMVFARMLQRRGKVEPSGDPDEMRDDGLDKAVG